ncbi:MAG TPA: Crp/Fnr family transcriptional regulator [Cytophagales bacterium]|nr:Crp/Fnr family transcriptional regulator [Cytophagales bacterium]
MGQELKAYLERLVTLEPEAWQDFEKITELKNLKKGQHFLRQDEVCKRLGFIIKGYMRVYFLANGEEITKDFNFEDSFCGSYASFAQQQASRFNVVAMENATVCTLSRDGLFALYDKYPSIQKVGRISMEQMFIRKEQRESAFLLDPAQKRYEDLIASHPKIEQRVPLKYLASYLGIRAETLSRIRGL